MKLELDVWCSLLDVYTKFQIDISKHLKKAQKILKHPKRAKIIAQTQEIIVLQKKKKKKKIMLGSTQRATYMPNLKGHSCKNEFDLFLAVK